MLYNGSDVIRDLEWVIFDEVHYINDAEVIEQWYAFVWIFCTTVSLVFVFFSSVVLCGRRYWSCYRNTLTSFFSAPLFPTRWSLLSGSGESARVYFFLSNSSVHIDVHIHVHVSEYVLCFSRTKKRHVLRGQHNETPSAVGALFVHRKQ